MGGDWAPVTRETTERYQRASGSDAPPAFDPLSLEARYDRQPDDSYVFTVELRSHADPWLRDTNDGAANRTLLRSRLRAIVETLDPVNCRTDSEEFWLDDYSLDAETLMARDGTAE